jgi:acyl-CoA reductase-like NAD-dependent aldehyde dehydrogenase
MGTSPSLAIQPRLLIDGSWTEGHGGSIRDVNPARPDDVLCELRYASEQQMTLAAEGAARASGEWARTPIAERAKVLARAAAFLDERAEDFGRELALEEGKTRIEGVGEVRRAAEILRYFASEAHRAHGEIYPSPRVGETIQVVHRPLGVVMVITPWNFPIAIPCWKIAPALVYGNAVIWKPASLVPVLATRLAQALLKGGLPPGVLSLVYADGRAASTLVEHELIDGVTFTGSTEVGRSLAATCGGLLKPLQLELGGNNAVIATEGPDLELMAGEIVSGAMRSSGQKCTATSRLIVEDSIASDLTDIIVEKVRALAVGDPLSVETDLGPLASREARESVFADINMAIDQGATRLVGGEPYLDGDLARGYFVAPTVLRLPSTHMNIWSTEVFGPVLSIAIANSFEHALALANDSDMGLSGAVLTDDLGTTLQAIDEFKVGVLHINSETPGAEPHVPFGGIKNSGLGPKEQGAAARDFFTVSKTVYLRAFTRRVP